MTDQRLGMASFILSITLASSAATTFAAQVPSGAALADKQQVIRQIKDEPASLDPAKAVGLPELQVLRDLFEGLTNQDSRGKAVAGVASHWETSDNRVWIFTLRDNARWSNGEPVTAQDFVYGWQRLVDPKTGSPFAWYADLAGISNAEEIVKGKLPASELGVAALDTHHLKVELSRPVSYFPSLVSHSSLFPVPRRVIEAAGINWTLPGKLVGNGAYQLTGHVVNEQLILQRNPNYWDNNHSVIDKVIFRPINQDSAATRLYEADGLDITESFPKAMYAKLTQRLGKQVYTPEQLGTYYFAFNTQNGPTQDSRVRRALSWSVDRRIITEKVLGTGEKPAWRFTPDITASFTPTALPIETTSQSELNQRAKELLHEAGYGSENPLTLTLLYNTSENNRQIAIAVASMWKKNLGVEVKLENQEWKSYIDSRNQGKFDVIRASWVGDFNEPSTFLGLLTSKSSGNIARYHNPAYDELLTQAQNQTDLAQRNRDYNQAERIIAQDVPIMPLYQYTNGRLIKPWLKGYPIDNPEDVAYSRELWIEKH